MMKSKLASLIASRVPRLVTPLSKHLVGRFSDHDGRLFLTFDDGPTPHTEKLLDLLDEFGAKASFFVLGSAVEKYPAIAREIVARGHTLGNHTVGHPDPWKVAGRDLVEELDRCHLIVEDKCGVSMRWVRPPYGRLTLGAVRWCARRAQRLALWDAMPGDYLPGRTAESAMAVVKSYSSHGSIIVLHDNKRVHADGLAEDILSRCLEWCQQAGFRSFALQ